jgi:uncharacterized membrane protein YfcA
MIFSLIASTLTFILVLSVSIGMYYLLRTHISSDYLPIINIFSGLLVMLLGVRISFWLKQKYLDQVN